MIRIRSIQTMPDYMLHVTFDDGTLVEYDVKTDMLLPGYHDLRTIPGLFEQATLDQSRTCVSWTDSIDLPSDTLYEYGKVIQPA